MSDHASSTSSTSSFLIRNIEKPEFNQYWYSSNTINKLASEVDLYGKKVAFLSTPSIYFSLTNKTVLAESYLFDYDEGFSKKCNGKWIKYDFNDLNTIPKELYNTFDMVVIDPPFITEVVWLKYVDAIKLLLIPDGKILLTTIVENKYANLVFNYFNIRDLLFKHLNVIPQVFRPSIPNLVYQYEVYANYESVGLKQLNPEIPE